MTIIDQLVFAPYICCNYLFGAGLLKSGDFNFAKENARKKIKGVLGVNYCYWPFVNFLNFRFVPMQFRMLTVNVCAIFWNGFMSYKNNKTN